MHPWVTEQVRKAPVLLDGAWGTQLQERGLPIGDCADSWNLAHPGRVEEVARAYVEAGSHIILTNTFGANSIMLERHGLADQAAEMNREGAAISKRAAGDRASVFGSIGPSGKMLMMGDVTEEALFASFAEQATALKEGGADGLVVETMADLAEAEQAVKAALTTGLPVAACMVYDTGEDLGRTMMGTTPEQAAKALAGFGAHIIGANCGQGVDGYILVCRRLREVTDLPLWIKPNAGLPEMVEGKAVYRTTPDEFAGKIMDLMQAGASFVGGCCGTSPDFIRAVSARLGDR